MKKNMNRIVKLLGGEYEVSDWTTDLSPIDILVGTILSQNTTDKNSISAYYALKRKYRTWNRVMEAPVDEVAETIRHGGLPNIKAKRIQATLREIKSRTGKLNLDFLDEMGTAEATDFLTSLHGVGPKTASVLLGFAFGKPTIPVDTHVHRVANRIGIVSEKTPARTQKVLEEVVPDKMKDKVHLLLIEHGRSVCKAQNPRCEECVLQDMCDFYVSGRS